MQFQERQTPAELLIGGHYQLLRQLASGTNGSTCEVLDTRTGQICILKTLSLQQLQDWKRLDLFKREARTLANLDHPRIPALLDYFESQSLNNLDCHLVTEKITGQTLAEQLKDGKLFDEAMVYQIAVQALNILSYLQTFNPPIIHRDLKPSNLMLDQHNQLWLIDFGGVQEALAVNSGGSTMIGTYGYMAPEQFAGRALPQSDLYGLGATLVHLLSRRDPALLPRKELLLNFRPYVECSERFANWLEQLLLPASEQRFAQARIALEVLQDILPELQNTLNQTLSLTAESPEREQTASRPARISAEQREQLAKQSSEPETHALKAARQLPAEQILAERYRIKKVLGQGEATVTYAAESLTDNTAVVIRELQFDQLRQWKHYELFKRELKTLLQLKHPALPQLIEHFEIQTDTQQSLYLVSRWIQAENLAVRLQQGWRPTEKEVRALADQLMSILVYLQRQDPVLIHRDIKPSNLLLDANNKLYLIDFGAVKEAFSPQGAGGSTVIGSFGYMAPEQAIAQAVPASDLYAAGATLIHLLTGRAPAELTHEALKIQFMAQARCSRQLLIWLEKLVEPDLNQRYDSAQLARQHLARLDRLPVISEQLQRQGSKLLGKGSRAIVIQDSFEGLQIKLRPMEPDYQQLMPTLISGNVIGIPLLLIMQVPLLTLLSILTPIYTGMLIYYLIGRSSAGEIQISLDPDRFTYQVLCPTVIGQAPEVLERFEYTTQQLKAFGLDNTGAQHCLKFRFKADSGLAFVWRSSQFPLNMNAEKSAYLVEHLQETLMLYQRQQLEQTNERAKELNS